MSKQQRNIKLLGIAGLAILAVAGSALIGYPLITQTQTFAKDNSAAQAANQVLQDKINALSATQKQLPEIQALNLVLSEKFPSLPNGTALLTDISTAAYSAGMNASNIQGIKVSAPVLLTPAAATAGSTTSSTTVKSGTTTATTGTASGTNTGAPGGSQVASMAIVVNVTGNGTQLSTFLSNLGTIRRVVKIDSVSLSASTSKNTSDTSMTVNATTYLYKAITVPSAPNTTGGTTTNPKTNGTTVNPKTRGITTTPSAKPTP